MKIRLTTLLAMTLVVASAGLYAQQGGNLVKLTADGHATSYVGAVLDADSHLKQQCDMLRGRQYTHTEYHRLAAPLPGQAGNWVVRATFHCLKG